MGFLLANLNLLKGCLHVQCLKKKKKFPELKKAALTYIDNIK